MIGLVGLDRAGDLAALHAASFDHPWDEAAFADLLTSPGVFVLAEPDSAERGLIGFIMIRVTVDEAEVLTLAVAPDARREGLGRRLVQAAETLAVEKGAQAFFLEVAIDNEGALALYRAAGFDPVGRRAGYYDRPNAAKADALVLKKPLSPARDGAV